MAIEFEGVGWCICGSIAANWASLWTGTRGEAQSSHLQPSTSQGALPILHPIIAQNFLSRGDLNLTSILCTQICPAPCNDALRGYAGFISKRTTSHASRQASAGVTRTSLTAIFVNIFLTGPPFSACL